MIISFTFLQDIQQFFKVQKNIICNPVGSELLSLYAFKLTPILKHDRIQIINICADHLMIVKNNQPYTCDKIQWAKCVVFIFPQLLNSESEETWVNHINVHYTKMYFLKHFILFYQSAVYSSSTNAGFLGNRLKTLLKSALAKKRNEKKIDIINKPTDAVVEEIEPDGCDEDVEWLLTANAKKDLPEIVERHTRTFKIRRQMDTKEILEKFPRFLDIHELVSLILNIEHNNK